MAFPYGLPYTQNFFGQYPVAPQAAPQQNALPAQQVLQANGKASIDSLRMSPNSSVLIMDTTAPIVWLCTSDGLGNVTPTAYDITLHKDAGVTQIHDIEERILTLEKNMDAIMRKWEAVENEQSDGKRVKSKQTSRNDGTDSAA